jgi:hypothetical protein
LRSPLWKTREAAEQYQALHGTLARILIRKHKVSAPKDKKDALSRASKSHKQKRVKEKLIRLDDLIPKGDVKGGGRLLFGATPPTNGGKKQ